MTKQLDSTEARALHERYGRRLAALAGRPAPKPEPEPQPEPRAPASAPSPSPTPAVDVLPVVAENIPDELKARPQWVLWKNVERAGRLAKVPFSVDGQEAKSNDSSTWSTFEQACAAYERGGHDGIGFVFSPDDPFCGIDLDGCRDSESGAVAGWAQRILHRLNGYSEISPSGTGLKVWVRGKSPFPSGRNLKLDEEPMGGKAAGLEIYDHGRYFAVTGRTLDIGLYEHITDGQGALDALAREYWPAPTPTPPASAATPNAVQHHAGGNGTSIIERARAYIARIPEAISGQNGHGTTFHVAGVLTKGFGLSTEQAMPLLEEYNARCQPPWTPKELEHKLTDAAKSQGPVGYLLNPGHTALPSRGEYAGSPQPAVATSEPPKRFRSMSLAGLMQADLEVKFLVDGILAAGQTGVLAGPQKTLKTTIMLDLCLSLAVGGCFLGRFPVAEPVRVGVLTAEIGLASVRKILRRIAQAAGVDPYSVENLEITDEVPMIGSLPDEDALLHFIRENGVQFLAVDPLYMCLQADQAGNTVGQGQQLRRFSAMCQSLGCSLLFCHHTKRETSRMYEPLDLGHLHGAGLPEFCRQWLLVSRRTPYVPGSGYHELNMVVGGSVGHESLWGLSIDEGHLDDPGGRKWEVEVLSPDDLRQDATERRKAKQEAAKVERLEADRKEIVDIMLKIGTVTTQRDVRERFSRSYQPFRLTWASLLDDGTVESAGKNVKRDNGQTYEGFRLRQEGGR